MQNYIKYLLCEETLPGGIVQASRHLTTYLKIVNMREALWVRFGGLHKMVLTLSLFSLFFLYPCEPLLKISIRTPHSFPTSLFSVLFNNAALGLTPAPHKLGLPTCVCNSSISQKDQSSRSSLATLKLEAKL